MSRPAHTAGDVEWTVDGTADAALVAAAVADPRAFAALYRRYVDPVYRYCARQLGEREAAEDATAEVFVKALGALPRCRPEAFRSWLFAIAHNAVVDQRRTARIGASAAALAALEAPDPTPEAAALAAAQRRDLEEAVARLSGDQRAVVELRLAGLTGVEIATALGRSPAATRMLQARAVARLRVLLAQGEASGTDG